MSQGVVLSSLTNSLKNKMCSLQNKVNLEDSEDIVMAITNNSNQIVNIHEAGLLCHVCCKKIIILIKNGNEREVISYFTQ